MTNTDFDFLAGHWVSRQRRLVEVLAGSDEEGDNITMRGTVDKTGTLLKASYILNGSATGRCETDDGTGNLAKR